MTDPPSRMGSLIDELKRRHVVKVAIYYAAAAFAVLQGADIVFPALGLPDWSFRLVVVFALLGFPVALLVAWVYDITPEGIIRTPAGAPGQELPGGYRAARVAFVIVCAVLFAGVAWLSYRWASATESAGIGDQKSVAVLPFAATGGGEEGRFFADGVHEDLLSALSRIGDLRVISRTSVQQYRDTDKTIPEIAAELGVGMVLEGSVRRSGGQIRVAAQLIDARTDGHVWSGTYDGTAQDVFALQDSIARQIAGALEAELSEEERARLAERPTESVEAYDAYNEGRIRFERRNSRDEALAAVDRFEAAVELDADFAEAWAALARARMWLFWNWPGFGEEAERAGRALNRAIDLAPNALETHLARGYFHFYGRGDYQEALGHFGRARDLSPSDAEARAAVGLIRRRQGRWQEAVDALREALGTDPRSYTLNMALGETYLRMRRFQEAEAAFDQAVLVAPDLAGAHAGRVRARLGATGDTAAARGLLEESLARVRGPELVRTAALLARYRGDSASALQELEGRERTRAGRGVDLELALAYHAARSGAERDAHADSVRLAVEEILDSGAAASPGAVQTGVLAAAHAELGIARALLGLRGGAIREGATATAILPVSSDAFSGADHVHSLALIYALVGEHDAAIDRLQESLAVPSLLTLVELRLDPLYDTLRDHPRFQELLSSNPRTGQVAP